MESNFLKNSLKEINLGEEVEILDFTEDEDFNNEDFYDYDHLNPRGAEKFSKKMKGFIND